MGKRIRKYTGRMLLGILLAAVPLQVNAADTYSKIIIEATDDNTSPEDLQYAIGSDDPEAFGSSNVFEVKRGEGYIVYVKDLAGNISSKIVVVDEKGNVTTQENTSGNNSSDSSSKKSGSSSKDKGAQIAVKPTTATNAGTATVIPADPNAGQGSTVTGNGQKGSGTTIQNSQGDGTVIDETSGKDGECSKEFYTIESEDGYIYYLIIDHAESEDNVYFLDKVKERDLIHLAEKLEMEEGENEETGEIEETEETQFFVKEEIETEEVKAAEEEPKKNKNSTNLFFVFFVMVVAFVLGYYFKIYKPKHQMLDDAYDLEEDFEAVDDEEVDVFIPGENAGNKEKEDNEEENENEETEKA